jgi:uncharacterized protein (TIGR03084 family)
LLFGEGGGRLALVAELTVLLADLAAESAELDAIVVGAGWPAWSLPTPAPGWSVAHQIAHLAWTDDRALEAATDEAAFVGQVQRAVAATDQYIADGAREGAGAEPAILLARWRAGQSALAAALRDVPPGRKLPWYGPPMSATSMATARLMETWAHGQDIADGLGITRTPTLRLRHVAWLGTRTRDFAFGVRGLAPPAEPFRVELFAPDGSIWSFGPQDAPQRVSGPALDFCLLVTQRIHRDDTDLVATGADADAWLGIAQTFAGPPGPGRPARATGGTGAR